MFLIQSTLTPRIVCTSTTSLMSSPGHSAVDIQSHLYNSFLEGRTADIALRISGTWKAVYRLHRVVLIQSEFFRSLFTSGFSESSSERPRVLVHPGPEEIDIVLDDHNITRAAFETCISRLYGGGPRLHIPSTLIPTASKPLTPNFPVVMPVEATPMGDHPASPRFLLSLIATALYLGIPTLAAQAVKDVLASVGPHTVLLYLRFALGAPLPLPSSTEPQAAIGLEQVAQPYESFSTAVSTGLCTPSSPIHISAPPPEAITQALRELDFHKEEDLDYQKDFSDVSSVSESVFSTTDGGFDGHRSFHYGAVSDRIGEAAACWLARWAPDMLAYEYPTFLRDPGQASTQAIKADEFAVASASRRRAATVTAAMMNKTIERQTENGRRISIPIIWGRDGLQAKWVRALVTSDALFVRGERERYDFAVAVVEYRRKGGIDPAEEKEWQKMFSESIYYSNMSFDDLLFIYEHVSPTTNQPYVPMAVLQGAQWNQSLLRHHITSKSQGAVSRRMSPISSPIPPSPPTEKMSTESRPLSLAMTTAELATQLSSAAHKQEESKVYYHVPRDSSQRMGDSAAVDGSSMNHLFDLTARSHANLNSRSGPPNEANFFGLMPEAYHASECVSRDASGTGKWVAHPPMRFAVEFWDVASLREKNRLHSHTIWYAGSLYNVYVQVVRKKGLQLGVYLHRQSHVDPTPVMSTFAPTIRPSTSMPHVRGPSLPNTMSLPTPPPHYSPSLRLIDSRVSTPMPISPAAVPASISSSPMQGGSAFSSSTTSTTSSSSSSSSSSSASVITVPAATASPPPLQPYRDPRAAVTAYFSIACANATGSSLTRFTSAPDEFKVSQSWGWKSSSLRTEEYLDVGPDGEVLAVPRDASAGRTKEISLRATVVIGVV